MSSRTSTSSSSSSSSGSSSSSSSTSSSITICSNTDSTNRILCSEYDGTYCTASSNVTITSTCNHNYGLLEKGSRQEIYC